jgi:thioredoxin reductase
MRRCTAESDVKKNMFEATRAASAGIGHQPNSGFLDGQLQLDDHGYVQVC